MSFTKKLLMIVLLTLNSAYAEQKKTFGNYDIHYSVVNSTFVQANVAKAYGIVRGKNHAFLNISIRKKNADGSSQAQKAIVRGHTTNLIQSQALSFKEISETGAIYYIAQFRFDDADTRTFSIDVQPNPNIPAYTVKFSQKIYSE